MDPADVLAGTFLIAIVGIIVATAFYLVCAPRPGPRLCPACNGAGIIGGHNERGEVTYQAPCGYCSSQGYIEIADGWYIHHGERR